MHPIVDIWDSQKMITHLINNDLRNERMRFDFDAESYNLRRSSLYKPIFTLLGITEPMLHLELSKYYRKLRWEINEVSYNDKTLKSLSEKIFSDMLIKTRKNAAAERQHLYEEKYRQKTDFQEVVMNMIKNDLMQKYNLIQLIEEPGKDKYDFDLYQPVMWMMKVWDRKWQLRFQHYYFSELRRINTSRKITAKHIELSATKIYDAVNEMKGNLIC